MALVVSFRLLHFSIIDVLQYDFNYEDENQAVVSGFFLLIAPVSTSLSFLRTLAFSLSAFVTLLKSKYWTWGKVVITYCLEMIITISTQLIVIKMIVT